MKLRGWVRDNTASSNSAHHEVLWNGGYWNSFMVMSRKYGYISWRG